MKLTPRIVAAVAHEEGLVLEAYKDSVGVWTWALGVTNASGHQVHPRYLDKPTTIERALEVSVWLLENRYLPAVRTAFNGLTLKEHEIAGALTFHWNTGAIVTASWVRSYRTGNMADARKRYLDWNKPASIIARRRRDAEMFFDGKWPDLRTPIWKVAKPSYRPVGGKPIDILPMLQQIMGGR
jgi:lysozyme